jgi:hypothetical protein
MSEEINSSTGGYGTSERQHDRWYSNADYLDAPNRIEAQFEELVDEACEQPNGLTRTVRRGVVSSNVYERIVDGRLAADLEAALPLQEFEHPGQWLVCLGRNHPERGLAPDVGQIQRDTASTSYRPTRPSLNSLERVTDSGTVIVDHIEAEDVGQLKELWGSTFDWVDDTLLNLLDGVAKQRIDNPASRRLWIAGAYAGGQLLSAATAERLSLPARDKNLELIESTEWRTRPGHGGRGLLTAVAIALHSQVLSSFEGADTRPLIFAECNYISRADRAAHGAGLRIPSRSYAPQVIAQNVAVKDGLEDHLPGLRDFTFNYLPTARVRAEYNLAAVSRLLQLVSDGRPR